jgi:hypothetical protein
VGTWNQRREADVQAGYAGKDFRDCDEDVGTGDNPYIERCSVGFPVCTRTCRGLVVITRRAVVEIFLKHGRVHHG